MKLLKVLAQLILPMISIVCVVLYYQLVSPFEIPFVQHIYPRHSESNFILFNVTNFTWILNPVNKCAPRVEASKILLILIHSARQYFSNRNAIRNTYGSMQTFRDYSIHIVFFLGQYDPSRNLTLEEISEEKIRLRNEHNRFGDTVMGNFIDSYRNLTYKHTMALTWATKYCPNAAWVLKTDDDVFLDLRKLLERRDNDLANKTCGYVPSLYCYLISQDQPMKDGTWKVSLNEYPHRYWPEFCYGAMYGVDIAMIQKWLSVYTQVKFLWIDDVFFTGIVRQKVKEVYGKVWSKVASNFYESYWLNVMEWGNCTEWDKSQMFKEIIVTNRASSEMDMQCLWKLVNLLNNGTETLNRTVSLQD